MTGDSIAIGAAAAVEATARSALAEGDMPRHDLGALSPPARQAAVVAAVLGSTVSFEHVSSMLETRPASLLAPMEELVAAELLENADGTLRFPHPALRHAVTENLPRSARQALRRQAIDVLLAAGCTPLEPATELAATAQAGDRAAIAALHAAARAVARSDSFAALEICRRAFELTGFGDERRAALAADVVALLDTVGRAAEGKAVALAVLDEPLSTDDEARLRLTVAHMSGLPPSDRVESGRRALAIPELTPEARAQHLSAVTVNLLEGGRADDAGVMLQSTDLADAAAGDRASAAAVGRARAMLAAAGGQWRSASRYLDDPGAERSGATVFDADVLLALDEFDTANQTAASALADAHRRGHVAAARAWQRFLGRSLLHTGRLDDAAAALHRGFDVDGLDPPATVADAAAIAALGCISIHQGDARRLQATARLAARSVDEATPDMRRQLTWLLALTSLAAGDTSEARGHLSALHHRTSTSILPPHLIDVTDHVHLARAAIAGSQHELARAALDATQHRARANASVASIAAAAAHTYGLVQRDAAALAEAAELLAPTPRRLARASALEDRGVLLIEEHNRTLGVDILTEALQLYAAVGADWDVARVRRRLRDVGVRRRLTTSVRPTSGWQGLTRAEQAVVELVAGGLTNRAAADQLFVSPHTVSMHLRHVFTKLGITSRVELTRIALERQLAGSDSEQRSQATRASSSHPGPRLPLVAPSATAWGIAGP